MNESSPQSTVGGLIVTGQDDSDGDEPVDVERWRVVAEEVLVAEGVTAGQLDLVFIDADTIRQLNRQHLGSDRATDVLAFPLDGPVDGPSAVPIHLGDVVICPEVAGDQAAGHTGDPDSELTLLVVHGVLHVLGHDHAEDDEREIMQGRERVHLGRYGVVHPADR